MLVCQVKRILTCEVISQLHITRGQSCKLLRLVGTGQQIVGPGALGSGRLWEWLPRLSVLTCDDLGGHLMLHLLAILFDLGFHEDEGAWLTARV